MDTAKSASSTPDPTTKLEEEVRVLVCENRRPKAAKPASETCDDVLAAGVTSLEDIGRLMEELLIARDFLKSEGERVRLVNARYGHMAKTAFGLGQGHRREFLENGAAWKRSSRRRR